MSQQRINILFIASEADPFVKIGGLGDVAGSLPTTIRSLSDAETKYDIRLAIPYYGVLKKKLPNLTRIAEFPLHTGSLTIQTSVYEYELKGMPVYFIDGAPIKEEDPVYGTNFVADAEKFIFFSLACLELPRILKWKIDILHANDWHTAIAIHQLATSPVSRTGSPFTSKIITIHNLPFMGTGSEDALTKFGIEPADDPSLPVWARTLPLPMGLSGADYLVPVSQTYAQEILTPDFGCGLETFLSQRKDQIIGILNGIDPLIWNPETDELIASDYNTEDISGKARCKAALQAEVGLQETNRIPLLVLISRMDQQKGVDLAIDALRSIGNLQWQAVILGSGDPRLEKAALDLQNAFPNKVKVKILFDSAFSHRMYAGADILMMPSRYEPCGLSQLISMKYGTIPVARATGGLKDTIKDTSKRGIGTGFLFSEANAAETARALKRAINTFSTPIEWQAVVKLAMSQDYSWANSAREYCSLYQQALQTEHFGEN